MIIGPDTAFGGGICAMFLSFGNLWMFGGLLAKLPEQKRFGVFESAFEKQSLR